MSGEGAKGKSKEHQRRLWQAGKIPTAWPRPYESQTTVLDPSKPPTMTSVKADERVKWWSGLDNAEKRKLKPQKPNPSEIPVDRFGDPNLAWFVDPRVAGAKAGKILVMFSGGKDSLALLLYACEALHVNYGLDPRDHVEVWHQAVDGRPACLGGEHSTSGRDYHDAKWDWPVTEDYVRAVCACLGLPLYFGWREGGLQGNVLKGERGLENRPQAFFELPAPGGGRVVASSRPGSSEKQARLSYPLPGSDLTKRWCSSDAKIDVAKSQLAARKDLFGKRILYLSGERAEESSNRADYAEREFFASWKPDKGFVGPHGSHGRYVEKWRPIHKWCELDVWAIIARWQIRAHPAYSIGFGRLSCMTCIFGSHNQWATIKAIDPRRFEQFSETEHTLLERKKRDTKAGVKGADNRLPTIKGKKTKGKALPLTLAEFSAGAAPYDATRQHPELVREALSTTLKLPLIQRPWQLPAGAFGENTGPT